MSSNVRRGRRGHAARCRPGSAQFVRSCPEFLPAITCGMVRKCHDAQGEECDWSHTGFERALIAASVTQYVPRKGLSVNGTTTRLSTLRIMDPTELVSTYHDIATDFRNAFTVRSWTFCGEVIRALSSRGPQRVSSPYFHAMSVSYYRVCIHDSG